MILTFFGQNHATIPLQNMLAVIEDYGDAFEGISGRNEPLKEAIGAAIWKTRHKKAQMSLHARHRSTTNTKLELLSSDAIIQ